MKIRLAVFDLAGTTVNDPDGVNQALQGALDAAGARCTRDEINGVMGLLKPEAIRKLLEARPERRNLLPRAGQVYTDFVTRMVAFYRTDPSVFEIPGTSGVFAELGRMGVAVAVNTGFGRDITKVILDRLGWERNNQVQASVASDEVARGRPFPDMIQHLMARLGIGDSRQVAKIGDTPADLNEGANASCGLNIGVTYGSHTRAQLEPHPHTHLAAAIAEVPGIVGSAV